MATPGGPARAACGGLNQIPCRSTQNRKPCHGSFVIIGEHCRIRPAPRASEPQMKPKLRKGLPSVERNAPLPPQPLCDPSVLLEKGGKCAPAPPQR